MVSVHINRCGVCRARCSSVVYQRPAYAVRLSCSRSESTGRARSRARARLRVVQSDHLSSPARSCARPKGGVGVTRGPRVACADRTGSTRFGKELPLPVSAHGDVPYTASEVRPANDARKNAPWNIARGSRGRAGCVRPTPQLPTAPLWIDAGCRSRTPVNCRPAAPMASAERH
ncbi:hypothetical protein BD309DRAFT_962760 [Dichomitus squalens]|nr:hypothetical protein BD309DRAFT_962760 [Dichomitus squalens]